MKRLIGLLIGIVLTINCYSQDVVIPETVLTKVIDELIVKDGLVYELNKKDSIIVVYQQLQKNDKEQIAILKIQKEEYQKIINNKDELMNYATAELKDKRKEIIKLKFKNVLLGLGVTIETIAILLLLLL